MIKLIKVALKIIIDKIFCLFKYLFFYQILFIHIKSNKFFDY